MQKSNDDNKVAESFVSAKQELGDMVGQFAALYNKQLASGRALEAPTQESGPVTASIIMPSVLRHDEYYLDAESDAKVRMAAQDTLAKLPPDFSIKSERGLDGSYRFILERNFTA